MRAESDAAKEGRLLERNYYDATSLERVLLSFETTYGISSSEFFEMHLANTVPTAIPGFHRHVWASFYRDVKRLRAGFAENAERLLALA